MYFPLAKGKSSFEKWFPNNSVKNFLLLGPNIPTQEYLSVTSSNFIFFVKFFKM